MSNAINRGRQWPLVAVQEFDHTDMDVAPSAVTITLPANAVPTRMGVSLDTVFGATTTMAVGITGTTDLYDADVDLNVLGYQAVSTDTGMVAKPSGETIIFTPNANAISASAGSGRFIVEYFLPDRANEVQP